jgi:hypothetical protein
MESAGKRTEPGPRPGGQDRPARPGQSGEGARSALDQLIQQEQRRVAQLPREGGGTDNPSGTAA